MQQVALVKQGDQHVDVQEGPGHQRPASSRSWSICSLVTSWPAVAGKGRKPATAGVETEGESRRGGGATEGGTQQARRHVPGRGVLSGGPAPWPPPARRPRCRVWCAQDNRGDNLILHQSISASTHHGGSVGSARGGHPPGRPRRQGRRRVPRFKGRSSGRLGGPHQCFGQRFDSAQLHFRSLPRGPIKGLQWFRRGVRRMTEACSVRAKP